MPFNLAKNYGGFINRKTIDFFVRFAEVCFKRYKDKVKYWMTFNEIDNQSAFNNDFLMATNSGILFKEGMTDEEKEATMYQAANYEFVASALAVKIGHKINPDFKIGLMINYSPVRPLTPSSEDTLLADKFEQHRDFFSDVQVFGEYPKAIEAYIEKHGYRTDITDEDRVVLKEGTVDYVAFSYYQSTTVSSEKVSADELSDLEKAVAIDGVDLMSSTCHGGQSTWFLPGLAKWTSATVSSTSTRMTKESATSAEPQRTPTTGTRRSLHPTGLTSTNLL